MLMVKPQTSLDARKQEVLVAAITIIASQGYAQLTMRALARASGMKLGALQYHFRTWEDLLRALADYIEATYEQSLDSVQAEIGEITLKDLVLFILDDTPGAFLHSDHLFPQLWAMAQVEPVMAKLIDNIYAKYLSRLEQCLKALDCPSPKSEALMLISLLEGSVVFVGSGRGWNKHAAPLGKTILEMIQSRYGT